MLFLSLFEAEYSALYLLSQSGLDIKELKIPPTSQIEQNNIPWFLFPPFKSSCSEIGTRADSGDLTPFVLLRMNALWTGSHSGCLSSLILREKYSFYLSGNNRILIAPVPEQAILWKACNWWRRKMHTGFQMPRNHLSCEWFHRVHCKFQHSPKITIWSPFHLSAGCQNGQFEIVVIKSFN